jgi:hypothetical protein
VGSDAVACSTVVYRDDKMLQHGIMHRMKTRCHNIMNDSQGAAGTIQGLLDTHACDSSY